MTLTAVEVFIIQLGRTGAAPAHKYLSARGLQESDRDDIIGAATLWCWNNRTRYSLTTTLETWFMNAVRDAYKDFQRNELPSSEESIDQIGGADDTYDIAAAESAARALFDALTPAAKRVAVLTMNGYTKEEMIEQGIPHHEIQASRARIKQLRRLLPNTRQTYVSTWSTAQTPSSDEADDSLSRIDAEIERLDFPPPSGKDCPPCWRCCYFEGFKPDGKRSTRMEIEDKEVREAVKDTESRKIDIANQVRG